MATQAPVRMRLEKRKPHRQFDWEKVLDGKALLAPAIARRLSMALPNTRRHLRWAVYVEKVVVVKVGRYKYYVAKETFGYWQRQVEEEYKKDLWKNGR